LSKYIPNTREQIKEMLADIGVEDINALFCDIPPEARLARPLNLPGAMSELEVEKTLRKLASRNKNIADCVCFLGAGAYDHYIPSVINSLLSRQEFYTAYTPYQPEISQGTLQAIFEYQTMIASLTGMDIANASLYDGAAAIAEAALLACRSGRKEVLVARSVHPESREVLNTYFKFSSGKVAEFGYSDGLADIDDLKRKLTPDTAAVIVQTPNFFGLIEDIRKISDIAHENKSIMIVSCDPISLGLLKAPGDLGADIVVGEGQCLGMPASFGGPYLGFMATKEEFLRKIPGRIVGETVDKKGRRGFVLTIQTREQHIRRERATSNICSNQALNALAATIYLSVMGKQGLKEVAGQCLQKARYAYDKLLETGLFTPVFTAPFFKEFLLKYTGDVNKLNDNLLEKNIIGGFAPGVHYPELENTWLVAVTEKRTKLEIDDLVKAVTV